jgi:sigma-B regulation protein RsbU (phosphoserine phosphatase)
MADRTQDRFHRALTLHRDTLLEWLNGDSRSQDVRLGGATTKGVLQVISELKDILERIDDGTFGDCKECDDKVESERLELDYTTCVCLAHYSEGQIRALERDLELAAKVQRQLLPCCIPESPDIEIEVHVEPARIVGGDYYDFFSCPGGTQGLAIADVMGKGLPASMLMSNLQASLRLLGPEHNQPNKLAVRLNELFRNNLKLISFISIFLAKIDAKAGILQYCNAGHHPPILWEAASGSIRWLKPTGPAIGLTHDAGFKSETLPIGSGDLLLLYTDGLVEARNAQGAEFGEERLATYVKDYALQPADDFMTGLRNAAQSFVEKFHDDVTLMVVKFL